MTFSCVTVKEEANGGQSSSLSRVLIQNFMSWFLTSCHTAIQADQSAHCRRPLLLIVSRSPPALRSRWRATCCPTPQSVQWQSPAPQKPSSSVWSRSAWSCWRWSICKTAVWTLLRPHTYAGWTSFFWSSSFFWLISCPIITFDGKIYPSIR